MAEKPKNTRDVDLCVGIDLGTTNSVLAIINEKANGQIVSKVVDIPRADDIYNTVSGESKLSRSRKPTLASCVYYRQEKNYEPLVGEFAKKQYSIRPHLVAKSIKSQMGNPEVTGLSEDVPDKTPSRISARILKHMIGEASKINRKEIRNAVITVPANFDSAMCKATLDAAAMAGIEVTNPDGTEKPILLSEPNAVIYDLINQISNGEISENVIDLSTEKTVLVFDLGGGTLDITVHKIRRRDEVGQILKVDEIATNRYTLLGGDDFDEEIAKEMYRRYIAQYSGHPEIVAKIRKETKTVMASLRGYAENLKIELNERCQHNEDFDSEWDNDYSSAWDFDDEDSSYDNNGEIEIPVGGNVSYTGYSYDDTFTKTEIEKILSVFMADALTFEDYKELSCITDTRNIIYPILDVLKKASEKLGVENIVIDEVIVNGGMSKFYMVTDRLKDFFGFEPIVALDPDLAVARGAAVYHYYLNKYAQMQDDMKMLGEDFEKPSAPAEKPTIQRSEKPVAEQRKTATPIAIEWGKSILNDSLYLGMKNGAVHMIIPTGAQLPYTSQTMTGFKIEAGQNKIAVPIKSRNLDGSYRIIANGQIVFKRTYRKDEYVAFTVHMGINKVITMRAWTSENRNGSDQIEEGYVEINIANKERTPNGRNKVIAPNGSVLQPYSEISGLLQLCRNYEKNHNYRFKSDISKRIASCVSGICNCSNKADFAPVVLDNLTVCTSEEAKQRLLIISRKIAAEWSKEQRQKLINITLAYLAPLLQGFFDSGARRNTNMQAIYTLSVCDEPEKLKRINILHNNSKYVQACLYTHSKTKTSFDWIKSRFDADLKAAVKGEKNNLQISVYAMGVVLRKDNAVRVIPSAQEMEIADRICNAILTGRIGKEALNCCIWALGFICDQRNSSVDFSVSLINKVLHSIEAENIGILYGYEIRAKNEKTISVVTKMINGEKLNKDEEQYLLIKLEQ